jgi:hypothetical protein
VEVPHGLGDELCPVCPLHGGVLEDVDSVVPDQAVVQGGRIGGCHRDQQRDVRPDDPLAIFQWPSRDGMNEVHEPTISRQS